MTEWRDSETGFERKKREPAGFGLGWMEVESGVREGMTDKV